MDSVKYVVDKERDRWKKRAIQVSQARQGSGSASLRIKHVFLHTDSTSSDILLHTTEERLGRFSRSETRLKTSSLALVSRSSSSAAADGMALFLSVWTSESRTFGLFSLIAQSPQERWFFPYLHARGFSSTPGRCQVGGRKKGGCPCCAGDYEASKLYP